MDVSPYRKYGSNIYNLLLHFQADYLLLVRLLELFQSTASIFLQTGVTTFAQIDTRSSILRIKKTGTDELRIVFISYRIGLFLFCRDLQVDFDKLCHLNNRKPMPVCVEFVRFDLDWCFLSFCRFTIITLLVVVFQLRMILSLRFTE